MSQQSSSPPTPAPSSRPWPDHVQVAILGSGFAGLCAAIELETHGVHDFVVLERGQALGGTWRDNSYPGCACDVPSHLYSLSFAPSTKWTRAFAPHDEIRAYLEEVTDRYALRERIVYGATVTSLVWSEERATWTLRTADGREMTAKVVVAAVGALANPAIPSLPGIEQFTGRHFHSASWDHDFVLRGKRVMVIGTGASAIQLVPAIQPEVDQLVLLQRSAPWVLPKPDRAFSAAERAIFEHVPGARRAYRESLFWSHEARVVAFDNPWLMKAVELAGKRHIARAIRDPALRAKVTPSYRPGCKRLLLSNDYYPALAQPNVEVVSDGVARVTEHSVVLQSGREIEVDAIVYGTGFAVHDYLGGMQVVGRGGATLSEAFARRGAEAYLGTVVAGYPNLFVMTGPNTGLGHNSMLVMIEAQARYMRQAVQWMQDQGLATLEVKRAVQEAFNHWLRARSRETVWLAGGCRSWYLDSQGRNTTLWPGLASAFRDRTAQLRREDFESVAG